jgi:hypothetical protein
MDDMASAKQLRIIMLFSGATMIITFIILSFSLSGRSIKGQLVSGDNFDQVREQQAIEEREKDRLKILQDSLQRMKEEACAVKCESEGMTCRMDATVRHITCFFDVGDPDYCYGIYVSDRAVCSQLYESCYENCMQSSSSQKATSQ